MNDFQNNLQNDKIKNSTLFQHRLLSTELCANIKEVYRYAGISNANITNVDISNANFSNKVEFSQTENSLNQNSTLQKLTMDAITEVANAMNCRSVYMRFDLSILDLKKNNANGKPLYQIQFADKKIETHSLAKNLEGCNAVYLFAATLGPNVDKLIYRNSKINSAKAVMLQAAGAMYIEEYCNSLTNYLSQIEQEQNNILVPRFSPGYGDICLETQKVFFDILKCQKNLALTLNDSLIMSPEKSVTAFIGVKNAL